MIKLGVFQGAGIAQSGYGLDDRGSILDGGQAMFL
jgi:hypothetical protein